MADPDPYRLPASVVPSRYDLTLEPDLDEATFSGFESVDIHDHGAGQTRSGSTPST